MRVPEFLHHYQQLQFLEALPANARLPRDERIERIERQ